jgi:DNA (cytosine-5)-methyltransferase 1
MTHGSLFSGIGGFDLAAEWMGWTNVFHCEWNPFGQKVLKHYWPDAELFTDITKSDFKKYHGTIDIISGGFPCQPYSAAGKRKGKEDERHLWPYMLDTIKSVRPRWVVGENVLGLVNWSNGLVFHEVQADLEAAGYEVWPYVLAAASVGAPHRRDRIWFVAYRNLHGFNQRHGEHEEQSSQRGVNAFGHIIKSDGDGDVADTLPIRLQQCEDSGEVGDRQGQVCGTGGELADGIEADGKVSDAADTDIGTAGASGASGGTESNRGADDVQQSKRGEQTQQHNRPSSFSRYAPDTDGIRQRRQGNGFGESKFNGQNCKRNDWSNFPTQSPICGRDDGIPNRLDGITFPKWRNESIKAYGNAVVPQVVHQIFKAIQEYENLNL